MTTATVSDLKEFGRQLHTWGAAVTAIKPGTKRPVHKWERWQTQPQTRPELDGLPWQSAAAVGIVNGGGGFRIFDIDAPKNGDGQPSAKVPESVVIDLLTALGLPDDYQWSYHSGSGAGYGVVIRCTEDLPPDWTAAKGVYIGKPKDGRAFGQLELRWATGQTVIDGAHPTGPGYQWRRAGRPFVAPAMRTAAQVIAAFTTIAEHTVIAVPTAAPAPSPSTGVNGATPSPKPSAGNNYAAAALADAIRQVSTATPGDRNNALFRQTAALAELVNGGILTRPDVERAMTGAALAAGLPADETAATIESAFKGVGSKARQPSPNSNGATAGGPQSPNGASGQSAAATPGHLLAYRPEDGGILDLWHDSHGHEWLYATGFEEWHKWTGTHWQSDAGGYGLKAEIADVIDGMNRTARALRAAAADDKTRERLTAYVNATKRTSARVASVEGLARLRRYVAANRLDAADVLNLSNGTLDLANGLLSAHDPADRLTYCLPYAYDPAAVAPNWAAFLSRIDPQTVDFLQEFAGYALTPDCRHEIALWFYGPPGGGKSTFLAGLQAVLGPKVTVLGLADIERNRFALANLPGKTLAVATEQPADYLASTHVLNALISGEPVTVDRKYSPAVTITPRVKLAWALNELPRVRGASDGIFRRVKIVEFPAIPQHERRPEMKAAIEAEAAGILNWGLAGLARLRTRGRFVIPAAIEAASREYAEKNDIPAVFVEECCETGPALSVQSQNLYNRYQNWCMETGHKAQSATSIATDWRRLGFEKRKTMNGAFWDGVAIKP